MPDVAPSQDLSGHDDPSGLAHRHSRMPLVVGAVISAVIAVAVIAIVRQSSATRCPASGCPAGAVSSPSQPHPSAMPTTARPTTAAPPTTTVAPAAAPPPLASVMPADVDLPDCRTTDEDPFLDDVSAYYACRGSATAELPYLQVWGYQFPDQAAYLRGVEMFNAFVKFDPTTAEGKCPPADTYGSVRWHTATVPEVEAGTLECYSDSSENHYYVWTDDAQYTIIVAESAPEQGFDELDSWWRKNNRSA